MSTIFGVHRENKIIKLVDDCLSEDYENWDEFIEVAYRGNSGLFIWKNELSHLLPHETKVYPLDNSAQGIYTISDIICEINLYKNLI